MKSRILATLLLISPLTVAAQTAFDNQWEPTMLEFVRNQVKVDASTPLPEVVSETFSRKGDRDRWLMTFQNAHLGSFRLLIEGPRDFRADGIKRSVLFITSGFFAGTKPVDLLPQTGDQIVAAFEYTPNPELLIFQPQELVRTLQAVPGRLYLSVKWLHAQPWLETSQFHLFAVSLGALYMPVAERMLQNDGVFAASTIFAFSGGSVQGPLREMFRQRMGYKESEILAGMLGTAMMAYDPSVYLSRLTGPKLIIHANDDEVFPRDSQQMLSERLVGPKMICHIAGNHIDIGRTKEIELTLSIVGPWVQSVNNGEGFPQIENTADTNCSTSM